jgi:hypothetical protein
MRRALLVVAVVVSPRGAAANFADVCDYGPAMAVAGAAAATTASGAAA